MQILTILGGGENEVQPLTDDEARHLAIGNSVNRTYESPYDSDHKKKKKETKKEKKKGKKVASKEQSEESDDDDYNVRTMSVVIFRQVAQLNLLGGFTTSHG